MTELVRNFHDVGEPSVEQERRARRESRSVAVNETEAAFERDLDKFAETLAKLRLLEHADSTPKRIAEGLERIRYTAATALQGLRPLNLAHDSGQDLERKPFNWPLVQALSVGFTVARVRQWGGSSELEPPEDYPTRVIKALEELRDAADCAGTLHKPKRGNAVGRTPRQALREQIGKNYVRIYRSRFSRFPPKSASGKTVEWLRKLLVRLGEDGANADRLLGRAIDQARAAAKKNTRNRSRVKRAK
jgi:hypothetical protein